MPKAAVEHSPVKVPLFSAGRERIGDFEVAGAVFGREGDNSLLHEAVRMQLANRRRGTASTKTKGIYLGRRQKTLAAEELRRRACGRWSAIPAMAQWRHHLRTAAA